MWSHLVAGAVPVGTAKPWGDFRERVACGNFRKFVEGDLRSPSFFARKWPTTLDQSRVQPPRTWRHTVSQLVPLGRQPHNSDSISNPQITPGFSHAHRSCRLNRNACHASAKAITSAVSPRAPPISPGRNRQSEPVPRHCPANCQGPAAEMQIERGLAGQGPMRSTSVSSTSEASVLPSGLNATCFALQ